jgi:hypothetical protein
MFPRHVDIGAALRRLADRRIEEAMEQGKFDNLAGAGQPLDLEPMPAEENTRLTWWCIRILRQNDYTPDEIRWRKLIDGLRSALTAADSEERVREIVGKINGLVRQINTLGTNAMKSPMVMLDEEEQIERFRGRAAGI